MVGGQIFHITVFLITIRQTLPLCHQEKHHLGATINLEKGSTRGTVEFPLQKAKLLDGVTLKDAWFAIIDASDSDFCDGTPYDCNHSPKLIGSPEEAMETDTELSKNGNEYEWFFLHDPGTVTTVTDGVISRGESNADYSPLKRFQWEGRTVVMNAPLIIWGEDDNQMLLVDEGGCDPNIRSILANPFFVGNGPTGGPGYDCTNEEKLDRYTAGQGTSYRTDGEQKYFSMKLHNSFFNFPYELPHYVVFEASKLAAAEALGVIHAPKLANLGTSVAQAGLIQFANGIPVRGGGPARFQPGIASYRGGVCNYVPMWLIMWFFYDCDEDGIFHDPHNLGDCGANDPDCEPAEGKKGYYDYDPLIQDEFDPFQMDDKGDYCRAFAEKAIDDDGRSVVRSFAEAEELVNKGVATLTRAPPGLGLNSTLQPDLYVNCPVIITLIGNDCMEGQEWLYNGEDDLDYCEVCSAEVCESLDLTPSTVHPHVCAESNTDNLGGDCSAPSTQSEANAFCLGGQMRLCTVQELAGNVSSDTGCGFDHELLWTSTSCGQNSGYFWQASGEYPNNNGNLHECKEQTDKAYVRCCADAVIHDECCEQEDDVMILQRRPRTPSKTPRSPTQESSESGSEADVDWENKFTCDGRDSACHLTGRGNWICEYTFRINQFMTMSYKSDGFPYEIEFPVFVEVANPWSKLYYFECLNGNYENSTATPCEKVYIERNDTHFIGVDGFRRRVSAVNGGIPAPTLCVGHRDIIRVTVINDIGGFGFEQTSIHWHGMYQRGTFWMDGVAGVTQCAIPAGLKYTYEFRADPPGSHWYHSHSGVQIAEGLFGSLIVQRIEGEPHADNYDDVPDHVLFLTDWDHVNYQQVMLERVGHWIDPETGMPVLNPQSVDGSFTSGHPYVSGIINGHGTSGSRDMKPYVFNVAKNTRTRFRMICGSAMFSYRLSIDDHRLTVIAVDGFDVEPYVVDSIIIFTAERYDFIVTSDQQGTDFWIRAETLSNDGEVRAILHYGEEGDDVPKPTTDSIFEGKCSIQDCNILNCPWPERYSDNSHLKCKKVTEMTRFREDDVCEDCDDQPDIEKAIEDGNVIFLNFNILGHEGGIERPNVEGIFNILSPTPPFLLDRHALEFATRCTADAEGTFEQCTHVVELEHEKDYIFVLTNRWAAEPDNPESGRNFPGAQPHPVHMHGHSFYMLDWNPGTLNIDDILPGTFGCMSGIGDCGFSDYCFDEHTKKGELVCNNYWGNCTAELEDFTLRNVQQAIQKDTVVLPPRGYAVIALKANNPGWWFFHCHLDAHLAQGMQVVLKEDADNILELTRGPQFPEHYPTCGNLESPGFYD